MSNVINFPKDGVFTRDGNNTNVFQNMVSYFNKWHEEGRITQDERNTIIGGLYSIKVLIEKEATSQIKEWLKAKARNAYRELDDFRTDVETLPPDKLD